MVAFRRALEGPLKAKMAQRHPGYSQNYWNFRNKNGPNCPFAVASVKHIMFSELQKNPVKFTECLKTGDWSSYD